MNKENTFDPKAVFSNSLLISKIKKNQLEEIRICILQNNKIDLRTYFYFPNEQEPKPTKKGIWLSFEQIPVILDAFNKISQNPDKQFDIDIERSDRQQIRIYTNEYLGNKLVHIRTFYLKDNEFKPGKGISFSPALIQNITEGLKKALEKESSVLPKE